MDAQESPDFALVPDDIPGRQKVKRAAAVDDHERARDYLMPAEVDLLLAGTKKGRFGIRDYAMALLAYRHGRRATELTEVRRADVDLNSGRIWVGRLKNGLSTNQPLQGDELRALRAYLRTRKDNLPWLFLSSQGTQLVRQTFNYLIAQAGRRAGLGHVHPHMLRHSCGYGLAERGVDTRLMQDWLGHRDIRHTAHYSRTSAKRFDGVWK